MRFEVRPCTCRKSRDCTRYASNSRLRSRRTGCATCCTNSAAVLSRATCTSTGSCRKESASVRMSADRSEEHTSELQSLTNIVCRLLLEKKQYWEERIYPLGEGCDHAGL